MIFGLVYWYQPNQNTMFESFKRTAKPVNVIEGLPHTQLEETTADTSVEELFN